MSKGFKVFLLILLIFLALPAVQKFEGVQKELRPYARKLAKLSKNNLILDNAKFGHVFGKNTIAQCNMFYRTITINKKAWLTKSEKERIIILAHEAGHCLRGLDHNVLWVGMCPESIMYPSSSGKWCTKAYWDKYVDEMRSM